MTVVDRVNPYIAGSPVTGTEMFFGREDVFAFVRETLTGRHRDHPIVLYGERRSGKTSVLYQMERHIDPRYVCVFIDLHGLALTGLGQFLWETASVIARAVRQKGIEVRPPRREAFESDPHDSFRNGFLVDVERALGESHLLIMFDEAIRMHEQVQAGKLDPAIFDYLRHLMQHYDWLNFIFSLGSGIEEMGKEYALLFSVAVYKRISFLSDAAGRALATEPVRELYEVDKAAVTRILEITSAHPYYTQLVCHCVFTRWRERQTAIVRTSDVDGVLTQAIELGSANLKFVWEDSSPAEKAVLAGMTAASGNGGPHYVSADAIAEAWAPHDVRVPAGEIAKATQSLTAREVVVRRGNTFRLTVDLQRLWLDRHRKLDWVKEEVAPALVEWERAAAAAESASFAGPGPAPSPSKPRQIAKAQTRKGRALAHIVRWAGAAASSFKVVVAVVGALAAVIAMAFVLVPDLRPEASPPVIAATLSQVQTESPVRFRDYLLRTDQPTEGISRARLNRIGVLVAANIEARGLKGKRLRVRATLVNSSDRSRMESRFVEVRPDAFEVANVVSQWLPSAGAASCSVTVEILEEGQVPLARATNEPVTPC